MHNAKQREQHLTLCCEKESGAKTGWHVFLNSIRERNPCNDFSLLSLLLALVDPFVVVKKINIPLLISLMPPLHSGWLRMSSLCSGRDGNDRMEERECV